MKILVTGGAGYIGSFITKRLIDDGYRVTVVDSLERGHKEAVDKRAQFEHGDLKDPKFLEGIFRKDSFDAVLHFAGYISVEESTIKPDLYYDNNVIGSQNLISVALSIGRLDKFIFSSSAAVYGNPKSIPIPERHTRNPTSPYGKTKLEVEEVLDHFNKQEGLSFVSLRYFNAVGAALDASLGENHNPETHIIPLAIKAALTNTEFNLFGTDYKTPDGTCIRDYIHVVDLVEAHILALNKLEKDKGGFFYNVGTGKGISNKEVLEMVKKVSGTDFKVRIEGRRPGDPEQLIADPTKIKKELGFKPKYSELETIVKSAFNWHKNNSIRQLADKIQVKIK